MALLQARGMQHVHNLERILRLSTISDKLGRRQIRYHVQILESGAVREWSGSHCVVLSPAPTFA